MKSLKEWRIDRYLSVRDLATKAGMSSATISYIENGKTLPQPKSIRMIAAALEVDPDEVVEFIEAKKKRV